MKSMAEGGRKVSLPMSDSRQYDLYVGFMGSKDWSSEGKIAAAV